jgi:S1-C subfamily serine protease
MVVPPGQIRTRRRRRMSGMTWMFLGLLIFFIVGGVFTSIIKPIRDKVHIQINQPSRSYVGVNGFETTEDGITFGNVSAPGSPADLAGLVGGDTITTVDGQPVHSRDEMMEILRRIPIGKTVDVVYIRDGETRNTKLTTVSEEESDRITEEFDNRPQGKGRLGFDDSDTERVPIPGTKMFGVRLDDVSPSLPADMAGIKNGDIIVELDGVPIRTVRELTTRVRRTIPYELVKVVVIRNGERLEIPVKMGRQ